MGHFWTKIGSSNVNFIHIWKTTFSAVKPFFNIIFIFNSYRVLISPSVESRRGSISWWDLRISKWHDAQGRPRISRQPAIEHRLTFRRHSDISIDDQSRLPVLRLDLRFYEPTLRNKTKRQYEDPGFASTLTPINNNCRKPDPVPSPHCYKNLSNKPAEC